MDDARRFSKWAGWSGLIASVAFLATVLVVNLTPSVDGASGPGDMVRYLSDMSEQDAVTITYGVAGILFCVLYVPMCAAINRRLGKTSRSWFGAAAIAVGLGILLPAYVINLLVPLGMAPVAEELGGASAETLYSIHEIAEAASLVFFTAGSVLTLAVGPFLWAREILQAGGFARWLGWTGLVTALSGLVWLVWFLDSPALLIVLIVNVLASLVFFFGVSAGLLRDPKPRTA